MRALVTGGVGFIGSHLVELLLEKNHEVIVLDNLKSGKVENLSSHPNLKLIKCDVREDCYRYFEGVDWVFHLAGIADLLPSLENPIEYFDVNVNGTLKVLEAARRANVKRLIYAASASCYGISDVYPIAETAPLCCEFPYALTKRMGEEMVLHWEKIYKLPAISLRLFNVYGPRSNAAGSYGTVFSVFLSQKKRALPLTIVGDGTQTRDFVFASDVARAFYEAALSKISGEIFNVGSGKEHSVNEIASLIGGEVIYIQKRKGETERSLADISKIRTMMGWEPKISFQEGVSLVLKYDQH